jgi:hypothetical protein
MAGRQQTRLEWMRDEFQVARRRRLAATPPRTQPVPEAPQPAPDSGEPPHDREHRATTTGSDVITR